jgi:hypothetical protein
MKPTIEQNKNIRNSKTLYQRCDALRLIAGKDGFGGRLRASGSAESTRIPRRHARAPVPDLIGMTSHPSKQGRRAKASRFCWRAIMALPQKLISSSRPPG